MFLDDELLKICEDFGGLTADNLNDLNRTLCRECEKYYQPLIKKDAYKDEVKTILDRTFNLWDSFVKNAKKSTNRKVNIIAKMCAEHTFKKQLLSNPDILELYDNL